LHWYSHCAFTGKALRFPKMMQQQGYEVIEYSNAGSQAGASEHVEMLSDAEFERLYGKRESTAFYGDDATVGSEGHQLFERRLIPALRERLEPQDIICHPFGHAHQRLMEEFPSHQHVETGIGYPTLMPNSYRIFESYAWMHYHQGKEARSTSLELTSPSSAASAQSKAWTRSAPLRTTAPGPSSSTAKATPVPGATPTSNTEAPSTAKSAVHSYGMHGLR
jgi:hypothetical protein